jgi:hypothetical protein
VVAFYGFFWVSVGGALVLLPISRLIARWLVRPLGPSFLVLQGRVVDSNSSIERSGRPNREFRLSRGSTGEYFTTVDFPGRHGTPARAVFVEEHPRIVGQTIVVYRGGGPEFRSDTVGPIARRVLLIARSPGLTTFRRHPRLADFVRF